MTTSRRQGANTVAINTIRALCMDAIQKANSGLGLAARQELQAGGIGARVVSLPCWELFDRQPQRYRDEVLPPSVKARVSVEEASTLGWDRYVGDGGAVVGMHTFGASAPLKQLPT